MISQEDSYIFGPVNSRRFGLSLGIDLSPKEKACNFDCLYCELEPAKPTDRIQHPPKVLDVVPQVKEALRKFPDIEVITITANGEPTLYPYLDKLIDELLRIKDGKKLLILSNASRIHEKTIQHALKKLDIVKLSLDCVTPRCFKRLDRPIKMIHIETIIEGIKTFRKIYKGLLVIETLVVKGINDKEEEFEKLAKVLQEIKPDRVDIGTIDRPPAYKVEPINYERLFELASFIKNLPVSIVARNSGKKHCVDLDENEILQLLAHRPLTIHDINTLFSSNSIHLFHQLLQKNLIKEYTVGNITFYGVK